MRLSRMIGMGGLLVVAFGLGLLSSATFRPADATSVVDSASATAPARAEERLAQAEPEGASAPAEPRDVYFPNTEELAENEMRIISCGTGMPSARESQAAACFLVELGNGDKFIFDGGTGSHVRVGSLEIPYDLLNRVFISHLHTDHFGDFAAYYIGGWVAGRSIPLRVWGPSGSEPELGTQYALEHLRESLRWDIAGRAGRMPPAGGELEIHEFDYRGENEVIYEENGVTIRSWPAIHAIDGSVSFRLEWNGLSFVYGGDTYPNRWFIEYAQNADVVVHECFTPVEDLMGKYNFPVARALEVGTQIHTTPESFGRIMSEIRPRMAIAFHFFNDFDTIGGVIRGVESTYDGPWTAATDYLVWNVTPEEITVREVSINENAWPAPGVYPVPPMDSTGMLNPSAFLNEGAWPPAGEVDQAVYDRVNAAYGTNFEQRN